MRLLFAVNDGQTLPLLSYGPQSTNRSGNLKGVHCKFGAPASVTIRVYVNGGAAQLLSLDHGWAPADSAGTKYSGWVPLNVRFSSSIRVEMGRSTGTGTSLCAVSWGLD